MKNIIKNITLLNVISSLILQIVTILSGFIIPKLLLNTFGSEVNGLVSSISQFLSYISLLEGGVTAVIISKLYKPLVEHNDEQISSIVVTAKRFYSKIGISFILYSLFLAVVYPIIFSKFNFDFSYIFSLTLILSLSLTIQYMLSLGLKCLLSADKKIYIISFTQIAIIIVNTLLGIISIFIYPSIHIFKLLTAITYFFQPLVFGYVVKNKYNLSKNAKVDFSLISDRWNGFANNIAYFIHNSTDISILTIFTDLLSVSVYSVYNLVTSGIKALVGSINNGIFPSIGHLYAKGDIDNLNKKFDIYEVNYLSIVFFVMTVTFLLITPFVHIYVGDDLFFTGYEKNVFGLFLVLATTLDLAKIPHVNLSYSANKFKDLTIPCFIEAIINISFSICLVNIIGIEGVAIGTLFAMAYRLFFQVSFTKKIIGRSILKFWKCFLLLSLSSSLAILVSLKFFPIVKLNVISWILYAIIYSIIELIMVFITRIMINFINKKG